MCRSLLAPALVAVVLVGCSTTASPPDPEPPAEVEAPTTPTEVPSSDAPSPDASPGTPAPSSEAPSDAPAAAPDDCDEPLRDELDAAIAGQLAAFAAGDWVGALDFATSGFRAGMPADRFERVITEQFPVAADATGHDTGRCLVDGDVAQALVVVEARSGDAAELLYLFAREDGAWRIDGAAPAAPSDDGSPTLVA